MIPAHLISVLQRACDRGARVVTRVHARTLRWIEVTGLDLARHYDVVLDLRAAGFETRSGEGGFYTAALWRPIAN